MSAASAELAAKPRGFSAGALIAIAAGLMVLSALVAVFVALRGGPIDGAGQLDAQFGAHTLPFGLGLKSAREMPGGERMVVFEGAQAAAPAATLAIGDASSGGKDAHVDWSKIALPAPNAPPERVVFLFLTQEAPKAHFDAFFTNEKWQQVDELGAEGGLVPIDKNAISWRGHAADFVHERAYEEGGTFRDVMRVNLSVEKKPCVMWASWPRGEQASRPRFEEILAALSPK
jgi:hypothetical protein